MKVKNVQRTRNKKKAVGIEKCNVLRSVGYERSMVQRTSKGIVKVLYSR